MLFIIDVSETSWGLATRYQQWNERLTTKKIAAAFGMEKTGTSDGTATAMGRSPSPHGALHKRFCIAEIHRALYICTLRMTGSMNFSIQNCLCRTRLCSPNAVAFSSICMHGIRRNITLGGYLDTRRNI